MRGDGPQTARGTPLEQGGLHMRTRLAAARIDVVIYDGVEPIDIGSTVGVVSMASRVLPGIAATTVAALAGPFRLAGWPAG